MIVNFPNPQPTNTQHSADAQSLKSFWEHLDDVRTLILRLIAVVVVVSVVCFCCKELLFSLLLAPAQPDFVLYRLFSFLSFDIPEQPLSLINTQMAGQLVAHLKVAISVGIVLSIPILLAIVATYLLPALYVPERRIFILSLVCGTLLFYVGMAVAYFLVFPLAYRFLIDYSVAIEVDNMITLQSYVDTLLILIIAMGLLFELPMVAFALGRLGIVNRGLMRQYRRHAVLIIVILAAIITPTTDALTLVLVSLPIIVLYEVSIFVVRK